MHKIDYFHLTIMSLYSVHCLKNNLNLLLYTKPVTVGAVATVPVNVRYTFTLAPHATYYFYAEILIVFATVIIILQIDILSLYRTHGVLHA